MHEGFKLYFRHSKMNPLYLFKRKFTRKDNLPETKLFKLYGFFNRSVVHLCAGVERNWWKTITFALGKG